MPHDTTGRTTLIGAIQTGDGPLKAAACVVVISGERLGQRADIHRRRLIVGRAQEADFCIPHSSVSRRHCELWRDGETYRIRDLGATNPTRVNDMTITEAELEDGDHIAVGECLLKFISPHSVEARYHAEVHQLATNDALTELPNRRHFVENVDKEITRSAREGVPLAMCIVDIDFFKKINDQYGHIAGDDALRQVALILRSFVRQGDIAARIGGEEFAVVLPETSAEQAVEVFAEPLRVAVESAKFVLHGETRQITVSTGIAGLCRGRESRSTLMQAADAALYRAKAEGRNQVQVQPFPAEAKPAEAKPADPAGA
jgi:diguanylate cyclase (GGDEF)-like protein